LAATVLGAVGLRATTARQQAAEKYASVRRYTLSGSPDELEQVLNTDYLPQLSQQEGFVQYLVIASGEDIVTITVFTDQAALDAAAQAEADWISQNLASLLPAPEETVRGDVVVFGANAEEIGGTCPTPEPVTATATAASTATAGATATTAPAAPTATSTPQICTDPDRPGVGCPCTTGTENPCGDNTLLCCATGNLPGGPGVCTPSSVGCDPMGPTPTPTQTTTPPPCAGEGCPCHTGTENPCGGDLVCCPHDPGTPGGLGSCREAADCNCTAEGCHCATGTENPCDDGLVCCPEQPGLPGGGGTCQPEAECAPVSCTAEGCPCATGTQSPCDDGLVCCTSQMGGGPQLPGGQGTCVPEAGCGGGDSAATPAA
jgi:hypothetical protein